MTSNAIPEPNPLPPSVYRRRRLLYFVSTQAATKKQTWHRLGATWGEARPEYLRLMQQHRRSSYVAKRLEIEEGSCIPLSCLRTLLASAKKNAKSRGLEFALELADLQALAALSGGKCQMTGMAFEYGVATEMAQSEGRRRRLWLPSLDRIESRAGYVPGNVRLVCFAVNAARQEFGDEVLLKIARALVQYPVVLSGRSPVEIEASKVKSIEQGNAETSIHAGFQPI